MQTPVQGTRTAAAPAIRFPVRMGNEDAIMWRLEHDPLLRPTTLAISILDKAPDRKACRAKLELAARQIPRLHQRVEASPLPIATPLWVTDPSFDLDYHLRWLRAPGDGTLRELLDLAAAFAMQGYDRSRPLWEFTIVEGLEGDRAAVLQKLHHAVTDGVGGMMLMAAVYESRRNAAPPPPLPKETETASADGPGLATGLFDAPRHVMDAALRGLERLTTSPLDSTRQAIAEVASLGHSLTMPTHPLSPVMLDRSTRYHFDLCSVPVAQLRSAAHAAGCKLNDAFLAAVGTGWRLYHERHGVEVPELRAVIPISLRGQGTTDIAGNHIMPARLPVPTDRRCARDRMRVIRSRVQRERMEPVLPHLEAVAGMINLVPTPLLSSLAATMAKNNDFVASCVPGPDKPLYLAGSRVETLFAFGPTAGTATNLTMLTYRGHATVTINADPIAVPDHELLLVCMQRGFQDLVNAA